MSDTVRDLLSAALARLTTGDSGAAAVRGEAQILLCHALAVQRAWLYAHADDTVAPAQADAFRALVGRREQGEPVAYLVGRRAFHALELEVTPAVLIPRADTELLVDLALDRIDAAQAVDIVDLGTGSGAIALALAQARPQARVLATDASAAALAVAEANAARLRLGHVRFAQGHWWSATGAARFGIAVSNPPYIADNDPHLRQGDLRFEPAAALASGVDGLDALRCIVSDAPAHLHRDGWLLLEHGHDQGAAVRALLVARGFEAIATWQDVEHRDRVSGGRWPA